jgi:hypothetical protein
MSYVELQLQSIHTCLTNLKQQETKLRRYLYTYFTSQAENSQEILQIIDGKTCTCPEDINDPQMVSEDMTLCGLFDAVAQVTSTTQWKNAAFCGLKDRLLHKFDSWFPDDDTELKSRFVKIIKLELKKIKGGPLHSNAVKHSAENRDRLLFTMQRRHNLNRLEEQNYNQEPSGLSQEDESGLAEEKEAELSLEDESAPLEEEEVEQSLLEDESAPLEEEEVEQSPGQGEEQPSRQSSRPRSRPSRYDQVPVPCRNVPRKRKSGTQTGNQRKKKPKANNGRPKATTRVSFEEQEKVRRKERLESIIANVSDTCAQYLHTGSEQILQEIKNPLLQRSLRGYAVYPLTHNLCDFETVTALYRGTLIEALFRYKFFEALDVYNNRYTSHLQNQFTEYVQPQNRMESTFPAIGTTFADRATFGYLLTDSANPCQVFFCCRLHGWQVEARRDIAKGTTCTFYDGFKSFYRQCQTVTAASTIYDMKDEDWLTRSGEFTHVLNLQNNQLMHDARFLLPSDHVGFASFFNASDNYNVQFVYGKEKTSDGTVYYVARAVAKEQILKGTIMTANYSYAPFQALKTDVLLNSEQCNNDLKTYILGHHARLDQVFVCRSTSPSSGSSGGTQ